MRQPLNLNSVEVPILFTTRFWATARRHLIIDNNHALSAMTSNFFTLIVFIFRVDVFYLGVILMYNTKPLSLGQMYDPLRPTVY